MNSPSAAGRPAIPEDRRALTPEGRALLANIQVRGEDIVSTAGPRAVVTLLRVLAGGLIVVMIAQLLLDMGTEAVSRRALAGDAARLVVAAVLLWAASEFAAMLIRMHDDLRAGRILMARLANRLPPSVDDAMPVEERSGAGHGLP